MDIYHLEKDLYHSVAYVLTYPLLTHQDILILPHHKDSLFLLGNMGINIDGCELFDWYYEPPTADGKSPWWWQLETANFLSKNPYAFVTSTPRTGKTFSTCMAMDFVQQQIGGSALIVAPLTVANKGEWYKTLKEWFPKKVCGIGSR